ncbi:MAG: host attachment protein [Caulobacterales bacterium]|jgi:protein required for attachment to host cells|nr:host attachment protein [Caulobacterales bacterium]
MLQVGTTWFLVADGRRAKVLTEPRRGADLQQSWAMEISEDDLYDPQDRPPRSFDSAGAGRHAMDGGRNLHEAEEEKFLKRVADRVTDAERRNDFDHLVVAAPPRALGLLRSLLSDAAQARVRAETPKDLLDEDAPKLRERLTDLLR